MISRTGLADGRDSNSDKFNFALLLLGCLTLPMQVVRVGEITISDVFFAMAAFTILLNPAAPKPRPILVMQIASAIAVVGVLWASVNAVDPASSLLVGARVIYIWTVWQWAVRAVVRTPARLELAIAFFVVGASISAVVASLQLLGGVSVPGSIVIYGRASGLQGHPNGQGGVLAVALPLTLGLLLQGRKPFYSGGLLVLQLMGLVICASVTGMLCGLIGVLVVLARQRISAKLVTLIALGGGALLWLLLNLSLFIPGAVSPLVRLLDTTGNGQGESTLGSRLLTDEFAMGEILRNPLFGVGLDAASGATFDGQTLTHNLVLLVWFQGGLLLLTALTLVLLGAVRRLKTLRDPAGPTLGAVVIPAACVGAFSFAMTGPVLYDRWFWFPFLLAFAASGMAFGGGTNPIGDTTTLRGSRVAARSQGSAP